MTATASPVTFPTALLIGDESIDDSSGGTFDHIFPATGQVNVTITMAGVEEIDRAVRSAAAAQREWAAMPVVQRRDLLLAPAAAVEAAAVELGELNVHDFGLPVTVSPFQAVMLAGFLRYYAGWV